MKRLRILIIFAFLALVLVGCNKTEQYEVNKSTTLKGRIVINTITKDGETEKVSILELEKAITIDGVTTDKIEIAYDKGLKDNTETTITGIIKENAGSTDLKYSIDVDSVDNVLSYINTFSNDIFSFAIPAKLMKVVTVREIKDGFTIYASNSSEAFKIIALTNDEYKKLSKDDVKFETIKTNKTYTVVIIYSNEDTGEGTKEEQELYNEVDNIKSSVKLK